MSIALCYLFIKKGKKKKRKKKFNKQCLNSQYLNMITNVKQRNEATQENKKKCNILGNNKWMIVIYS